MSGKRATEKHDESRASAAQSPRISRSFGGFSPFSPQIASLSPWKSMAFSPISRTKASWARGGTRAHAPPLGERRAEGTRMALGYGNSTASAMICSSERA